MKKVISMLVALSMLLCMGTTAATAEAAYTPGTYTATAAGFGGHGDRHRG